MLPNLEQASLSKEHLGLVFVECWFLSFVKSWILGIDDFLRFIVCSESLFTRGRDLIFLSLLLLCPYNCSEDTLAFTSVTT